MRLTATPLRQALRASTRELHDRVDAGFMVFDLSRPDHYRAFLQVHARALLPLEAALDYAGAGRVLPDWPARRRGSALLADLLELGEPPPGVAAPLNLEGTAQLWGVLYALEGSRLGGKVLARSTSGPRRYLTHGAGSRLWPEFLTALEGSDADPAEATAGAQLVFARFEAALSGPQLE